MYLLGISKTIFLFPAHAWSSMTGIKEGQSIWEQEERWIRLCFQWQVSAFCPSLPQVPLTVVAVKPSAASHLLCPTLQWILHSYKVNNTFPQVPALRLNIISTLHVHSISSKNSHSTHLYQIVLSFWWGCHKYFFLIDSSLTYLLNLLQPAKEMDRGQALKVYSCCYCSPWAKDTSDLCPAQPIPGGLLDIFISVLNHNTSAACIINGDS